MSIDMTPFSTAAWLTFSIQMVGFLVAYALQTEVFYDILGGMNFLFLAFLGLARHTNGHSASIRLGALTILFVISRGWLLLFLAWRAHDRKGDSRFDGVKDRFGLFLVFWMVQGFWVFLISWPLLVVQTLDPDSTRGGGQDVTTLDFTMLLGMAIGVIVEIVSDIQKTVWVLKGRPGGFCTVGLWSLSRHPNYFGEIFQWWCAWLLSYGSLVAASNATSSSSTAAYGIWLAGIISPLFTMTILLSMSGTGIWAAEGKNLKRYYESEHGQAYQEYRQSTSPLIPMIGYKGIPMSIKRQFLFEWERFEYNPKKGE